MSGIDVAVCEITGEPPRLRAEAGVALTIPWPHDLQKMVIEAWQPEQINTADLCLMDVAVGEAFAAAALEGIANAGYYPEQIDLIGMQGQPIHYHIREDGRVMGMVQLGQVSVVAAWTGITTVGNFRQSDLAAGGLGAPLVGYVDWLLLRHSHRYRAVQHLGELTSVTFVSPLSVSNIEPLCFDIGPGMRMVNYAQQRLDASGAECPENGG
ncbi:MAG: anhydro-N-acetylmuramic acid kinase, partial [Anaerolineae bacterium]|nr:anhydro-N-acetylmuramic acid kinase [Anaerolineae bacterium]